MRRFIQRLWILLTRRFIMRVDRKTKCPACGSVQKHKITFAREFAHVIHTCAVCNANWGTQPVIPYEQWKISEYREPENVVHAPARFERSGQ